MTQLSFLVGLWVLSPSLKPSLDAKGIKPWQWVVLLIIGLINIFGRLEPFMLKRGTIYLLDEPTTGLDNAVARSLQKTLDKLAENATTICITHHLGDLKTSDDVIYLDAGHIVEHGSFEELMNAKVTFYQQVNARGDE